MDDIFNIEVSEGSTDNFSNYTQRPPEKSKDKMFNHVENIKVANVEDTGPRVNGEKSLMH
jgi:hypothetical protein